MIVPTQHYTVTHTHMPFTVLLQRYDSVLCQKTRLRQYNPAHAAICLKDPTEFQCRDELHAQILNCSTLEMFNEASLRFFSFLFQYFYQPVLGFSIYIHFSFGSLAKLLIRTASRISIFHAKVYLYICPAEKTRLDHHKLPITSKTLLA